LFHLHYHKIVPLGLLPILLLIVIGHTHAELEKNDIRIIYPSNNSQVQVGNLTIKGTTSYDSSKQCAVYARWNDTESFPRAIAAGNGGQNYSRWNFNYDSAYHEIVEGTNNLTAQLSCLNLPYDNIKEYYSLIIYGIREKNNNSNLSDIESELSYPQPNIKLSQPSENNDVFSGDNFEFVIPTIKVNNSDTEISNTDEFNIIDRAGNKSTLQNNNTQISTTSPSILEIGSNQSFNNFSSNLKKTQLFADAGKDQTIYEGTTMILNGSNSMSNNSVILSYAWQQIPNPNITIGSANTMIWSFIAPNVSTDTTLTFKLAVTDNKGITSTDNVNVIVRDRNSLPNDTNTSNQLIADAGQDQIVEEGSIITLEGKSTSANPDDDVSFQWIQIGNSTNNINAPIWSFRAPFVETDSIIPFQFVVTNGEENKATDIVDVTVKNSNNSLESEPRKLVIQTVLDKNPISKGEKQIIKIDLFDDSSDDKINDAKVTGNIIDASKKIIKKFSINDSSGEITLNIGKNAKIGNYIVSVNASAAEFISANMDTTFKVQK
jgi:hypothetical protein